MDCPTSATSLILPIIILSSIPLVSAVYTLHSSLLYLRTADRTPPTLPSLAPTTLTPLGAQQAFSVGQFFRQRYITSALSSSTNTTSGLNVAPVAGLNVDILDSSQVWVQCVEQQWGVASAMAFLQGFYPGPGDGEGYKDEVLNEEGVLGNGSYIQAPLSGYQYPLLQTASPNSEPSIYTSPLQNCPAYTVSVETISNIPAFSLLEIETLSFYMDIGDAFLTDIIPASEWDYAHAYDIYAYVAYQYQHNMSVYHDFNSETGQHSYSDLARLRWLADSQQSSLLGDISATNTYNNASFEVASQGGISTIAGATLAAKVLDAFFTHISSGGEQGKVNLLVGEFEAFLSFFALVGLSGEGNAQYANFQGIPEFGSVLGFELFSDTDDGDGVDDSFPDQDQLWVRFLFRNGTDQSTFETSEGSGLGGLQAYPIFGRGPSETDVQWLDFVDLMLKISVADPGDWCQMCGSEAMFCAAWNSSDKFDDFGNTDDAASRQRMRPALAGLVGAVVALAVIAVMMILLALAGGFRIHRVARAPRGGGTDGDTAFGGFKGSKKLHSDPDLMKNKNGAVFGATIERTSSIKNEEAGHDKIFRERVGSWELKETERGVNKIGEFGFGASVESLDVVGQPVRPEERV